MAFRPPFQNPGFQAANQQGVIKRNPPRLPTQGPGAPQVQQTIYIDQSQAPSVNAAYSPALHQQIQLQYGRAMPVTSGPASGVPTSAQVPGPQAPQASSLVQTAQAPQAPTAYALQSGPYLPQGYTYPYIGIQGKPISTAATPQPMAFYAQPVADNIMVSEPIYQAQTIPQQQFISNISKPSPAAPSLQPNPMKKIKPDPMQQQYMPTYGNVMMNSQIPQQQQPQPVQIQQQGDSFLQRGSKFQPNLKQPPGLFNIVPRGDLPGINFIDEY